MLLRIMAYFFVKLPSLVPTDDPTTSGHVLGEAQRKLRHRVARGNLCARGYECSLPDD